MDGCVIIKHRFVKHKKCYDAQIIPNVGKSWTERQLDQDDIEDLIEQFKFQRYIIRWERVADGK